MSDKTKIVYIITSFSLGGAENLLLNLVRHLDKSQFEVYVCSVVGGGPLANDFKASGINAKVFYKKTKLGLAVIWSLYKYLRVIKPDIVHTHLFGGDTWGRLAAILARVPVLISTEHSVNFNEPWYKKIVKFFLSFFTTQIVAVSQGVKEHSVKAEKIAASKIKVIYNGIDLHKFIFTGLTPINIKQSIEAIIVARLEEVKGHRYLLEAMPLILKKYHNFKLNIVGTGSLEQELKNLVFDLDLTNQVVFWGQRFDPEKILPNMDMFILPSLWEGLGVVLLEAQAIGLPVLTSDIAGTREVVEDKKTGLLFEPKDPEAIFQTVDALLSQPKVHAAIINQAYQQVKTTFTLEKMVTAYTDLYWELLRLKKH